MAHIRDFRHREYWSAVSKTLGPEFASAESPDDLDQVIYNPRQIVCTPPPQHLQPGDDRVDQNLVDELQAILSRESAQPVEPEQPVDWQPLDRRLFRIPEDVAIDSLSLAVDLTSRYPEQVAPVCYAVTQQHIQPGEDPEPGHPVPGLPFAAGASPPGIDTLGQGVLIAVIDTGIDRTAVQASGLPNQEFDDPDDVDSLLDPSSRGTSFLGLGAGHGTFIAGLIHAVAPGAAVRSYRVANPMGVVGEVAIAEGIRRAVGDGAHVINLSLGGYPFVGNSAWPTLPAFPILEAAIAGIPDTVAVVAAAGNCGSGAPFYPAAFTGVIGVAALDSSDRLWDHSNYGDWVQACARGVNLCALFVKGTENPAYDPDGSSDTWDGELNFATWSGTSFAAPLVAAQIAVLAAEMGLVNDTRGAAGHLLDMSRPHPDPRGCGRRILVDLPGQS